MHYITPRILYQYYQLPQLLYEYNVTTLPFIICLAYFFSVNTETLVMNRVIFYLFHVSKFLPIRCRVRYLSCGWYLTLR